VKRALTLIELIIVFFILIIVGGSLSFGYLQYARQAALKEAKDRIERLLSQADFLSTVLQQETEVFLVKQHSRWHAILKPWGDEENDSLDIFGNLPSNFVELDGIEKILFNETDCTELALVFLPMKGIDPSYVKGKDSMGSSLTLRELGLDTRSHTITSMKLTLQNKEKDSIKSPLNLLPYARITTHIPIPQEYVDLDA
jgi:hypothetical protein